MCKKNSILLLCISLFIISCKKNNSIKTIDSNLNQENLNKNKIEIEERPRTFDRELDWYIGKYDCIQASIYFKTDYGEESYDGKLMLKPSFYDSEKVVPALEFYDDKGVRLRSQRNLNCDVIATLYKGQSVRPYAKSDV
ncbi:MAG: hypothetical protein II032_00015, partial [Treponema sp.]|nr:hypothetical protein [Treponema sp.]